VLVAVYANAAERPDWVVDSSRVGYITGLGIGKYKPNKSSPEERRELTARMMAQSDLAKQINIFVESQTYVTRDSKGKSAIRLDTTQSSIVNLDFNQAEELERWIDPKTKSLYLLLGLKEEMLTK
jgi:hypothetical protein